MGLDRDHRQGDRARRRRQSDPADRHPHRHFGGPSGPDGTRDRQGRRDARQQGQERLPGDDEPRDPHADERDHRPVASARPHRTHARARATTSARCRTLRRRCSRSSTTFSTSRRSRPESSSIESVEFDIDEVARGTSSTVIAPKIAREGARAHRRPRPGCRAGFVGDPLRLSQILTNLFGNAAKFTAAGEVTSCGSAVDRCDDGRCASRSCGRRHRHRHDRRRRSPTLFRPFTQADASISRRFGGTGLGLAICRQTREPDGRSTSTVESQEASAAIFTLPPCRCRRRRGAAGRERSGGAASARAPDRRRQHGGARMLRAALTGSAVGATAEATASGARRCNAWSRARRSTSSLLDWKMPEMRRRRDAASPARGGRRRARR